LNREPSPRARVFWARFESATGCDASAAFYESFHFGDSESLADELAALVVAGIKRATASLLWTYEADGKPLPRPGDLSIVERWSGAPLCVIETTSVAVLPFEQVGTEFAATEGEGDGSLEYWRTGHRAYFGRECARIGMGPSASMPVVCECFKVVYRERAPEMPLNIRPLRPGDRTAWEGLARGYKEFYATPTTDSEYALAWNRLLIQDGVHGLGAFAEDQLVGIAHYLFHTSVWARANCYLQDLFTLPSARGKGVARSLIEAVAVQARAKGAARYYWLTQEHNTVARVLYDKVARHAGFIRYDFPLQP
jgi:uncharacterized protein YhfF/GNAT superfamily N-acetyltransferase